MSQINNRTIGNTEKSELCAADCACHSGQSPITRRDFLLSATLAASAVTLSAGPAVAGPFRAEEFQNLIPEDKKLSADWLKALPERGQPTVYRGAELEKIGMPVGGLCCGQLYLGGDGKLWHWDLFNLPQPENFTDTGGPDYEHPPLPASPIEQDFSLKVTIGEQTATRSLDSRGFPAETIRFQGQYPVGRVDYHDSRFPIQVSLTAFSPFIPLNVEDSSLPVTLMRYLLKNTGQLPAIVELVGRLENAVCLGCDQPDLGQRRNTLVRQPGVTMLHCTAETLPLDNRPAPQPDLVFDDFEHGYGKWTVTGDAFGTAPAPGTLPGQQAVDGFEGRFLVNSFRNGDGTTGTMTSQPFTIARRHINFLIGGGSYAGQTCINLVVDGKVVRTATGHDNEHLEWASWDVSDLKDRQAHLEIVDHATGGWGHINIDQIVFSDTLPAPFRNLTEREDYGSMGLALLDSREGDFGLTHVSSGQTEPAVQPFGTSLIGAVGRRVTLQPGDQTEVTFLLVWYFPGLQRHILGPLQEINKVRRAYGKRFNDAQEVAQYVAAHAERLMMQTLLWNNTWYDSTLPYWFLDRTFASLCTLATSTCYQFDNGRFYAFEGVYCCQGTCQHVWNYAQALARIFPSLERDVRERVDFGLAWHPNGATDYRGECGRNVAHDGQCGVILRAFREHQMSPDASFLRRCWPHIRRSIEYMIGCKGGENGLLEGVQYNTLDAAWYGSMAWISSLYIASLRAGEAMATEMGDTPFTTRCRTIAEHGSKELVRRLYNGEYFIHLPDPNHPEATNTNNGCHIDQLMGQAWALQIGLPRIAPRHETIQALRSLWRYNFTPDVGPYREQSKIRGGRWYAMPGEGGMLITTFPHGGIEKASGRGGFAYYLNEVWTGQEHQVAAHLLWEGEVEKGLAVVRMLHDRHHASKRNPYNEVECSDHYSRAMSSYGSYVAASGYEYHGPKGHLGFAPRLTPENFRAAFTAAEGWGTFDQEVRGDTQHAQIRLLWGTLRLKSLALALPAGKRASHIQVTHNGSLIPATLAQQGSRVMLTLPAELVLNADQSLTVTIT